MKFTKILILSVIAIVQSESARADRYSPSSIDFSAPIVGSKVALSNVPAGTIVYEPGTGFWGLTPDGAPTNEESWARLGTPPGSSPVTAGSDIRLEIVRNDIDCTSSPCPLSFATAGVSSVTRNGVGTYVLNFNTGTFSGAPTCTITAAGGAILARTANGAPTATTMGFSTYTIGVGTVSLGDGIFNIICAGPR